MYVHAHVYMIFLFTVQNIFVHNIYFSIKAHCKVGNVLISVSHLKKSSLEKSLHMPTLSDTTGTQFLLRS